MPTTSSSLAPAPPRDSLAPLKAFLAEDQGVLRFMEKLPAQSSLVIESARRGRSKEPPKFPIVNAGAAAAAYGLIMDYFERHGHDKPLYFADNNIVLSLSCGSFSRTTDDLKRDLGLLKFERPPLPDTTIDLHKEAAALGLSPAAALKAMQREAARQTTKSPVQKHKTQHGEAIEAELEAAAAEALARGHGTLCGAIHKHRVERQNVPLPEDGYRLRKDALAATRLANNFSNLQKRLKLAGLNPLPRDGRVLAAQRLSKAFFRSHHPS